MVRFTFDSGGSLLGGWKPVAPAAEYRACMSSRAAFMSNGCRKRDVGGTSARAAGSRAARGCSMIHGTTRKALGRPRRSTSCKQHISADWLPLTQHHSKAAAVWTLTHRVGACNTCEPQHSCQTDSTYYNAVSVSICFLHAICVKICSIMSWLQMKRVEIVA